MAQASRGRTIVVNRGSAAADDGNRGTEAKPLRTINAAARRARAGDTVLVHEGVYRERVCPARGGTEKKPIVYRAAPGEKVCLRGSEVFRGSWKPLKGSKGVMRASLRSLPRGEKAYNGYCDPRVNGDFDPFEWNFNRAVRARPHKEVVAGLRRGLEDQRKKLAGIKAGTVKYREQQKHVGIAERKLKRSGRKNDPYYYSTLGQVFVDGRPLVEVQRMSELRRLPGTWMVSASGKELLVHDPDPTGAGLAGATVEISVRHTVFAPLKRRLGYIHVTGFVIEHGANHFPTWGPEGWPQSGLLSCRTGHHWLIENNTIRYAKGLGVDCGSEGSSPNLEFFTGDMKNIAGWYRQRFLKGKPLPKNTPGGHIIRNNVISDNGHCGIAGICHYRTRVTGNVLERNNRDGYSSPWWEFGGMKFHFFAEGLIDNNLIRDNDCHGIWLDNQWRDSRVTRNVFVNNLWSGINMEYGRGPMLIDNNIFAYTRQGDGVYAHDASGMTIAHNLVYANSYAGVWLSYGTPRVKPHDNCWDNRVLNNLILSNKTLAVGLPMDWEGAGNNVSESNLFMGGGETLDEASGSLPPLFQIANKTHCGQLPDFCPVQTPMTEENTIELLHRNLDRAKVPAENRPNMKLLKDHWYVGLDLWRASTGSDRASRVMWSFRDALYTRLIAWECEIDETIREVKCRPVKGVDIDFRGKKMPRGRSLLPGPFQELDIGIRNRITLWPVR